MAALPAAALLRFVPAGSSLAAAIALTAVYSVITMIAYVYVAVWRFAPYLDSAFGAGGKQLGFLLRAIFLANGDINLFAASSVFVQSGMSACGCAVASLLSDWFRHAAPARALAPAAGARPRAAPAAAKLLMLPLLAFGPGVGVPAAVLMYGVRTPDSMHAALRIRKWGAWGTLATLAALCLLALLALALAARPRNDTGGAGRRTAVLLVLPTLASALLLLFSAAARVRALYQPSVSLDDALFYPLVVLPELLQQLLAAWPALLLRCGLADEYAGWRTATWPWVSRRFPAAPAAADAEAAAAAAAGALVKGGAPLAPLAIDASASSGKASSCGKTAGDGGGGAEARLP